MNHNNNKISKEAAASRQADFPIAPYFVNRWSPRSFLDKAIPDELLFSLFEAARWAPSSRNVQPWRFLIARSQADLQEFHSFILEGNLEWCANAPVLALVISQKHTVEGTPNRTHSFDTGTAWGFLALQALENGLVTHAMGGFNREKARETLQIPDEYELHAVIAIGYRGDNQFLSETYQEREQPSSRRPVHESLFEGKFGEKLDMGFPKN
jgi:nitroreductase